MILTCPNCETQSFAADDTLVGEGRKVRCTACGHGWTVEPPARPGTTQAHALYLERKRQRARRARATARLVAWSAGLIVFAGAVSGAILFRERVVAAWPQSASVFAAIGMPVNRFGLETRDVTTARTFDGTVPLLTVTGEVVSVSDLTRPVPFVRIDLLSESGAQIGTHWARLQPGSLPPGGRAPFSIVIANPPPDAYSIDLQFDYDGPPAPPVEDNPEADGQMTEVSGG